jgi:ATP-dependent DNA helicase RecQ
VAGVKNPRTARRRIPGVLKKVFGLAELRPGQQEVIDAVLAGEHTLAIMPTGAGKSLCYQLPALLMPGMTVVVSPLIALMRDQFDKMSALGIESVQVNSAVGADEIRQGRARIGRRTVEFVFTTPEQLASAELPALLAGASVDLVVIDEAHCISQWGHDFRPAYLEALTALRALGTPTILALTATAPPEVIGDITHQLHVGPLRVVNTGVHRPNLSYRVVPVSDDADKQRQLIEVLRQVEGAAIVYGATVRHVDELAALLKREGVTAVSYHGRMRADDRSEAQDAFMSGLVPIVVATNAFGMGIDRSDIRAVIHYDLPASLDIYYQESGRAGRDGQFADCVLLFQRGDRQLQKFFMAGRYPEREDFIVLLNALRGASAAGPQSVDDIRASVPTLSAAKVRVMLTVLKDARLVQERRGGKYEARPGLVSESLDALADGYDERRQRDHAKLEQMVVYAQTALCRTRLLLNALGEEPVWTGCGACDNCSGAQIRAVGAAEGAA